MGEQNTFQGKTVEEAVASGLKQLGLKKDEVIIEILNEGRKGILKRKKDAEVRIVKKAEPKQEPIQPNPKQDQLVRKGEIWVEKGKILCTNPNTEEEELIIHIPPIVQLYKNNELMKEKTAVLESDVLKVDFKNEEEPTKWIIEIAKDRLTATIKVDPGTKTIYKLRDHKPVRELTLEVIKSIEPNLTLTAADIHEKLKSLGISVGIQEDQIEKACKTEHKAEFVIAKGESPVEGKHGWLEYYVEINEGKSFKEREDGSIDYREGRDIPSVDAGTTIALIHDPIDGKEGRGVTGEVLKPKPVLPLNVKAGNGTAIKDDKIIATSLGRPSVQKRGKTAIVSVLPTFEHQGDVCLASGNLRFKGDINISGNVEEHMEIVATGNIEIRGTVSEAKINAGQSIIHYSNVISSEITAGTSDKIIVEKTYELNDLLNDLIAMQNDLNQISNNPSFAHVAIKEGIMPLLKVLIHSKYMPFVNKIRQFMIGIKNEIELLNSDWQDLFKNLQTIFIMMDGKALQRIDDFEQLVEGMTQLIEQSNTAAEFGVTVQMPSAMNSTIYSSGDVNITKQGCYNCIIHAQGAVEIKGFIRGGKLFAGLGVKLEEAGSKGGTPTFISVPHDQTITIKNVYSDTTIQIGKRVYKFTKDMTNIVARIDELGNIALR